MSALHISQPALNPAQRLLGADVFIVGHTERQLNRSARLSAYTVNHPDNKLPSQFALISSPAAGESSPSVELLFLKHQFTPRSVAVVYAVVLSPEFLALWNEQEWMMERALRDNESGLQFAFDGEVRELLSALFEKKETDCFEHRLQDFSYLLRLLQIALERVNSSKSSYAVPACSFLNSTSDQGDKVMMVREILDREFDQVLSIKELSRRVAINECYLKKGFKAMFGKTINEYQQHLRIEEAKRLLQQEGQNVSSVANVLGYSSISHFSTAFKRATNMKPCELLK